MATLCKQALLGVSKRSNAIDKTSVLKTTAFCLQSANQLAARLGGAASLIEAQTVKSHGRLLTDKNLATKMATTLAAVKAIQDSLGDQKVECRQILKANSTVDNSLTAVDPSISDDTYKAVAKALRGAQAATLGVASVTRATAPSPLDAKAKMLANIYLTAQKQSILAKINRPYLLLLNKSIASSEEQDRLAKANRR